MNKNIPLITAGFIFLLVAIAHIVRLYLHIEIIVSGHILPLSVSIFGSILSFILSIWMFLSSRRG
jgi:hypothetical protein